MALTISSWALSTFGGGVVQAYSEADMIGNDKITYHFEPGRTSIIDYKVSRRTPSHAADGALTNNTTVENSVTTTVDLPLIAYEYVQYSHLSTNGQQVPQYIAQQLGRNLAEKRMNIQIAALLNMAITRAFGGGGVSTAVDIYNDEGTDGSDIFGSILNATSTLTTNFVPTRGRYCFLRPTEFYELRKYAPSASRDYQASAPNADNAGIGVEGFMLFQTLIMPVTSIFNTDLSSNTTYASKYRTNFATGTAGAGYNGVVWHPEALRLLEIEKPNGVVSDSPENQSALCVARCQFGTGEMRPESVVALKGDNT